MARAAESRPVPGNYLDHEEMVTAHQAETGGDMAALLVPNSSRAAYVSIRDRQGRGMYGREYVLQWLVNML